MSPDGYIESPTGAPNIIPSLLGLDKLAALFEGQELEFQGFSTPQERLAHKSGK
jgi:hypothetical protein